MPTEDMQNSKMDRPIEELTYEEALSELETIVTTLESELLAPHVPVRPLRIGSPVMQMD